MCEIQFDDIEFFECCGGGTFGSVYRGQWRNLEVAVKKVLALENEAQVLSSLSHKHIITFHGAVTTAPNYCLVTEYASLGSLYAYLADPTNDIDFTQILTWSKHIALGINYLHKESAYTVIHRDLKSRNCVITSDLIVKLCDFGSSRFHGSTQVMTMAGTFPWMAPEVILSQPISDAADIFSFGVVLWELLTREVPFKGLQGIQVAWVVVEKEERLTIPSTCPESFAKLIKPCWDMDPKKRPSISQILLKLEAMINDESLSEATSTFLSHKNTWRREIDDTMVRLRSLEKQLEAKQNHLDNKENELQQMEKRLYDPIVIPFGLDAQHDVNFWSEQEVYLWIMQLKCTGNKPGELAQYAPLFMEHNITGRRLLLLSMDDLFSMGVTSLGHRKDLQLEIQELRLENYRLQHFPPLSVVCTPGECSTKRSINMTLLFGQHSCKGSTSAENKWKMYMDIDSEHISTSCIRDVTFTCDQLPGNMVTLTTSPYVMDKWVVSMESIIKVECLVTYQDTIKKPRSTKHTHELHLKEATNHVSEIRVQLMVRTDWTQPNRDAVFYSTGGAADSSFSSVSSTGSSIKSLQGAWLQRNLPNSVDPSHYSSKSSNPGLWAGVVSGKTSPKPGPHMSSRLSVPNLERMSSQADQFANEVDSVRRRSAVELSSSASPSPEIEGVLSRSFSSVLSTPSPVGSPGNSLSRHNSSSPTWSYSRAAERTVPSKDALVRERSKSRGSGGSSSSGSNEWGQYSRRDNQGSGRDNRLGNGSHVRSGSGGYSRGGYRGGHDSTNPNHSRRSGGCYRGGYRGGYNSTEWDSNRGGQGSTRGQRSPRDQRRNVPGRESRGQRSHVGGNDGQYN